MVTASYEEVEKIKRRIHQANKNLAIQALCAKYNYKWPRYITSGVMFYDGIEVTIDEFNNWARKFK